MLRPGFELGVEGKRAVTGARKQMVKLSYTATGLGLSV